MTMMERSEKLADPLAALQAVAVECVHFDAAGRPGRRWLMPLAGLLAPLEGREGPVSPARHDGLRDAR